MSVTSYAQQSAAFAGLIADHTDKRIVTGVNAEASNPIQFGRAIAKYAEGADGSPTQYKRLASGSDIFGGFLAHSHAYNRDSDLDETTGGVLPEGTLNVMEAGVIWAYADKAVTFNDDVYVRYTANGAAEVGMVTDGADSGKAMLLRGASFLSETTGAGLVKVSFDARAHRAGLQAT